MKGFVWCPHCRSPHALSTTTCPTTGQPLAATTNIVRGLGPGTVIGERYKVIERVGDESIAYLYEARQRGTGRRVLVKVVHSEGQDKAECAAESKAMEREAHAASLVEHPNVAPVLDAGKHGSEGEPFLVRERATRSTLAGKLRIAGALRVDDAGDILTQILSGLSALHREGVVHRDLGTHNIVLVERAGYRPLVRIAGLGRSSTPKLGAPPDPPSGIHYSSPELLAERDPDYRSDFFACGVMLFEMLTGRRPFEAATPDKVKSAILVDTPPSAAKLRPELAGAWAEVLEMALQKDPRKRYQDALDFQEHLPSRVRPAARRPLEDAPESTTAPSYPSSPPSSRADLNLGPKCDRFIGRRIAKKYEIELLLGSGSAGAVYKATHVDLKQAVAIKVLHEWNRTSVQFVERFKAEALAASKLDHPNVTRIRDCGEEPDGTLYLVMDYVDGSSLETVLAAEGRMPQERAVNLAVQIVGSLAAAHEAGIIHRDVKPENIMLVQVRGADMARVCDFGLAKLFDGTGSQELTKNGLMLGSPAYMAPEQIRGEPCDERTDVYAAGVTLFELLTGRLPHEATSLAEMFFKKVNDAPARPSSFVADIDPLLEDIIVRALSAKREARHASARVLHAELVEVAEQFNAPQSANVVTLSV